ncbi:hypothetical protein M8818_003409 [Zalaria obscura]|uniref:Uncharacterized protein n=1 Tax=Zalaria obscura TaxID=2024903 RepID=A0ACC3SGY3_9PEZI
MEEDLPVSPFSGSSCSQSREEVTAGLSFSHVKSSRVSRGSEARSVIRAFAGRKRNMSFLFRVTDDATTTHTDLHVLETYLALRDSIWHFERPPGRFWLAPVNRSAVSHLLQARNMRDLVPPAFCQWLDASLSPNNDTPSAWQPEGCMFHKFKPMEALPCLRHRVVSLSGDSTTRQIFWSIVGKSTLQDTDENRGKHEDVHLFDEARNTSLHFYWNPFLNRSTFLETQFDEPSLFLFGGGLWQAKYSLHHNLQDVNINEATHLAPIQAPHFEWLSEERRETLLPERIAEINDMEVEGPFGSTCCRTYPPFEDIKTSFAAAMLFLVGLLCFGGIRDRWRTTCCALMKILLVLAYCFLADRTHIFSKAQKQYHGSDFHVLCGIALIIGLCRLRHITASPANMFGHVNLLLTQEQTNEWKGWMQAIILIYHYTGASRVYWIYVIARLLVASYLFLTGYGNTLSFLVKKDYSISRVTAVLLKLNMLSAALPWVMQTSYMDYYFAPLYLVLGFQNPRGSCVSHSLHKDVRNPGVPVSPLVPSSELVSLRVPFPRLSRPLHSLRRHADTDNPLRTQDNLLRCSCLYTHLPRRLQRPSTPLPLLPPDPQLYPPPQPSPLPELLLRTLRRPRPHQSRDFRAAVPYLARGGHERIVVDRAVWRCETGADRAIGWVEEWGSAEGEVERFCAVGNCVSVGFCKSSRGDWSCCWGCGEGSEETCGSSQYLEARLHQGWLRCGCC